MISSNHSNSDNYSKTWQRNSDLINKSIESVSFDNFYLTSAFAGFYDAPSPFVYTKRKIAANSKKGLPELSLSHPISSFKKIYRKYLCRKNFNSRYAELRNDDHFLEIHDFLPDIGVGDKTPVLDPFYKEVNNKKFNGNFLKCAEQAFNIDRVTSGDCFTNVCEIGDGFGAMAEIIIKRYQPANYFIIDLKETLKVQDLYLKQIFPGCVFYADQHNSDDWLGSNDKKTNTNIVLIDVEKYQLIFEKILKVDLFVNSNSFAEMKIEVVKCYFDLIESYSDVYLSNTNRHREEDGFLYQPTSYPYSENWSELFQENQRFEEFKRNVQVISHLKSL